MSPSASAPAMSARGLSLADRQCLRRRGGSHEGE
jgi:hypothetical protein